jgi:hypothetical protein
MSSRASPHGGFLFHARQRLSLFELASVLVRLNHVATGIVNANHSVM